MITIKSIICGLVLLFFGMTLAPDEAQYWLWGKNLSLGYYSKPPGIAWQIAATTQLFGDTEFGVRCGALLWSALEGVVMYAISRAAGVSTKSSYLAALVFLLSPLGILGSFAATTDAPYLFFWSLALFQFLLYMKKKRTRDLIFLTLWIACGALFKWSIYWFFCALIVFHLQERSLSKKKIQWIVLVSLLGLVPSLIWNFKHEFITFTHVWSNISGGKHPAPGNFFDFLGCQILLLSPILYFCVMIPLFTSWRQWQSLNTMARFCLAFSCLFFVFFHGLSFVKKMQGNWLLHMYPTVLVVFGVALDRSPTLAKWTSRGIVFSLLLSLFILLFHSLLPFKVQPFRHHLGWNTLPSVLEKCGCDIEKDYLFGDKYQVASLLSFYNPIKKRAYFLIKDRSQLNQFYFWPSIAQEQKEQVGYFFWVEVAPKFVDEQKERYRFYYKFLKQHYQKVTFQGSFPLFQERDEILQGVMVFRCEEWLDFFEEKQYHVASGSLKI